MTADLLTQSDADDFDIPIEPDADIPIEIEPELEIDPEPQPPAATALEPAKLMEILPADFRLPSLIKFIPNQALRLAAEQAATYALSIAVEGPEGLQRADLAVAALRGGLKAIDEHLEDPIGIANELHKRLTGIRSEWKATGTAAVTTVGGRIYTEQRRLAAIEDERRRKEQEQADRQARETARLEAEAAAKAKAPEPVVQELKRQAEIATAPPIARVSTGASSPLRNSTPVTTWKARVTGTPGADEPNPAVDALTVAQRHQVFELLKAILDGRAPLAAIALDWSYLNKRAKADKSTLAIPGIEAFEEGSLRAKGSRGAR